ncbi:hypothetical protein HOY80DRAFT_947442 [Tuber brumale]|nr:hypothetical protein HOY80DRAFT_947442 [Tuber brumale]
MGIGFRHLSPHKASEEELSPQPSQLAQEYTPEDISACHFPSLICLTFLRCLSRPILSFIFWQGVPMGVSYLWFLCLVFFFLSFALSLFSTLPPSPQLVHLF